MLHRLINITKIIGPLSLSIFLSSCQFGFMSIENEVVPVKQAINFSTDPLLIPSRLVMTLNSKKSIRLGLCEQVEILVSNAKGLQVKLKDDITVSLTSNNSQGRFYSDDNCTTEYTPSNSLVLKKGENEKRLYYRTEGMNGTKIDSIGANRALFTGVKLDSPVVHEAITLKFNNPPTALNVGVCSGAFTVSALDGLLNVFSENSKSVALGQSSSVGVYYSDSDCKTLINKPINIPQSSTTVSATSDPIYFKVTSLSATSVTLNGTFTGLTSASATVTISRTATALRFNTPPTALNVGVCSGAFTVSAIDGLGNPFSEGIKTVVLGQSLPLPSSLPLPIGAYYSDSSCSSSITPITSINVSPSLPTSSSIYFKVTSATATSVTLKGTVTATATATAIGLTTLPAKVSISHKAIALRFNSLPTGLNVGVCSGAFTVSALDGLLNVFSENSKSVDLGQSSSEGVYYSNSDCTSIPITSITVPQSSSTVSATSDPIYFKVTSVSAALVTLNGTFTGLITASATVAISHLILDTTFGSLVSPDSPGKTIPNSAGEILALEKYGDGYLIAGYTKDSNSVNRAYLALLNTAGRVTSSFTDSRNNINSSQINSILVVGSAIYVGGFADMGGPSFLDYYISKFKLVLGALTLNPDFNQTGTPDGGSDSVIGLALNNNSNLVVIGDKFEVLLFNSLTGAAPSGFFSPPASPLSVPIARKAVKDSAGSIIIAGQANNNMAVLKIDPDVVSTASPTPIQFQSGIANSIALDISNRILLAGTSGNKPTILRLDKNPPTSLLDTTFGASGVLQDGLMIQGDKMTQANDIILDSAGNILIVGTTSNSNQMALRRYQPTNGSFSNFTINSTTISFSPSSVANRIILDGFKIVLGGNVGTGMGMARLHP